jgi:hypothetical protein
MHFEPFRNFFITALFLGSSALAQQESRCASCHFTDPDSPARFHLSDWDRSPHRSGAGCERCHGGDTDTFDSFRAHRTILNARNPASPVHPRNLPATCGSCHTAEFVAFQKSHHYTLLREGDPHTPTCSTCHGEVAARSLSPKALVNQCAKCHGENRLAPREDYPVLAGQMLEGIYEVRALMNTARPLIRRVEDRSRRTALEADYRQAEVPLSEAVSSGHRFVFDQLQERLGVARSRANRLLDELANPAAQSSRENR